MSIYLSQFSSVQFSSDSATPWTTATRLPDPSPNPGDCANSCPSSVMPSNHLILCCPLLLLPSVFPSNRIFSNESVLHMGWTKDWNFSFSISPSKEYSGLIAFRMTGLINLQSKGLSRVFSNITVQKCQFFIVQLSLWSNSHIYT